MARPGVVLMLALAVSSQASAADYFVSPGGDDTGPGALEQPFRTVQRGVDAAFAGDTVYVMNGTYTESVSIQRSGQADKPLTVANFPGHAPIIRPGPAAHAFTVQIPVSPPVPIAWVVIEGFELTGAWRGIYFTNALGLVIRRNHIHDNVSEGVRGTGFQVVFERNVVARNGPFEQCARDGTGCGGTSAFTGQGNRFVIINNVFDGNLAHGLEVVGSAFDPAIHAGIDYSDSRFWLIAHNTFARQIWKPGLVFWQGTATDGLVLNNIFYENAEASPDPDGDGQGVSFFNCGTNHSVRHNLFFASGVGGTTSITDTANGASYAESDNLVGENPLEASAGFQLSPSSPAVDRGVTLAEVATDFTGRPRPQGAAPDLGAYELFAAGTTGNACVSDDECSSGFCVEGLCCDQRCSECGNCAQVRGAAIDGVCTPFRAGSVCRPGAGSCDVAEACDGVSGACPPDGFLPRGHSGEPACALLCSGTSPTCGCSSDGHCADRRICLAGRCVVPPKDRGTGESCGQVKVWGVVMAMVGVAASGRKRRVRGRGR
jgi:hypothetical protein